MQAALAIQARSYLRKAYGRGRMHLYGVPGQNINWFAHNGKLSLDGRWNTDLTDTMPEGRNLHIELQASGTVSPLIINPKLEERRWDSSMTATGEHKIKIEGSFVAPKIVGTIPKVLEGKLVGKIWYPTSSSEYRRFVDVESDVNVPIKLELLSEKEYQKKKETAESPSKTKFYVRLFICLGACLLIWVILKRVSP